jgi:hypothetical protein
VLVDIDGPLPTSLAGYDDGSPAQNDLTRLRWDRSGSHVTRAAARWHRRGAGA